VVKLLE